MSKKFKLIDVTAAASSASTADKRTDWDLCVLCQIQTSEPLTFPAQLKRSDAGSSYKTLALPESFGISEIRTKKYCQIPWIVRFSMKVKELKQHLFLMKQNGINHVDSNIITPSYWGLKNVKKLYPVVKIQVSKLQWSKLDLNNRTVTNLTSLISFVKLYLLVNSYMMWPHFKLITEYEQVQLWTGLRSSS